MYKTLHKAVHSAWFLRALATAVCAAIIAACSARWPTHHAFAAPIDAFAWASIALALLLVPANVLLESLKWRALMPAEKPSIRTAITQVAQGMAVGFLTPARTGEPIGRMLGLAAPGWQQAATATVAGGAIQFFITMIAGLLAVSKGKAISAGQFHWQSNFAQWYVLLALLIVAAATASRRLYKHLAGRLATMHLCKERLPGALAYATLRYVVYTLQFAILLRAFGVSLTLPEICLGVGALYMLQSLMPITPMGELGVRESLAVWIFAPFAADWSQPLMASLVVWSFNLVIPVLAGALMLGFSPTTREACN